MSVPYQFICHFKHPATRNFPASLKTVTPPLPPFSKGGICQASANRMCPQNFFKILFIFMLLAYHAVSAETKVYDFKDPALELRYQGLTQELRCLVCQNQNIADSHAELAQDLRSKVYDMLMHGDSDAAIIDYMTQRYGDFVLYNPPVKSKTLILWLAPLLTVVTGGFGFWLVLRRRGQARDQLSASERQGIKDLLKGTDE